MSSKPISLTNYDFRCMMGYLPDELGLEKCSY